MYYISLEFFLSLIYLNLLFHQYLSKRSKVHCKDCDLKLANKPYAPTVEDLHRNGRNFPPNFLHESWMDYLYWDIELEP